MTPRRQILVENDEYAAVSEGRVRIRIGVCVFLIMLSLAIVRLAGLALFSTSVTPSYDGERAELTRANITDRHGDILATTLPTYRLEARPKDIWDAAETARKIAQVRPGLNYDEIYDRLTRQKQVVYLERGLSPREKEEVFAFGLPGLDFVLEPKRVYPNNRLASHVLGYTDPDLIGLAGLELAYHESLSAPLAPDLVSSLDMRVQHILATELFATQQKFHANTGAGIVLNIKTGEIIALASVPDYDPNIIDQNRPENRRNHATTSTYDLGSVFKPITIALGLHENVINLTEVFPVHKPLVVRKKSVRDDHTSRVPLAVPEILSESSNRGTAMIALRAGEAAHQAFLQNLGLFDRVPIEISESARPQIQEEWQDLTTVTVSYGHGISVSPLALGASIGAMLNGGEYIVPTLIKRDSANPDIRRRVISEKTSQTIRDLMRYVVTDGTGRNAAVPGYGVMGKTGTADKPSQGRYDEGSLVSSFVAAFPYDDPTYLVMITLDEPKAIEGTYGFATAGWNATPTVGTVIERIAPVLGVKRRDPETLHSPFGKDVGRHAQSGTQARTRL